MGIAIRAGSAASLLALAVYLGALVWLGRLDAGGPPHIDLVLDGGIPGTLYVPPAATAGSGSTYRLPPPPPRDALPPAVVLLHGFGLDREGLSILARSLAMSGYAALAVDARGHGENRNPFTVGRGRDDFLAADIRSAVEFLRTSPQVDGHRIALLGHSMGARAVLEYGSRDPAIDGLVLISGGGRFTGPYRPPNALFVTAELDPQRVRDRAAAVTARLAERPAVETGRIYGEFPLLTATSHVEVSGADHATVLGSSAAILQIVAWLDRIYDENRSGFILRSDPRLEAAALAGAALVFLLPGLGALLGLLAPRSREEPGGGVVGLVLLGAAALGTMPLFATGSPLPLLGLEVGDVVVPHLSVTGAGLLLLLHVRGGLSGPAGLGGPLDWGRSAVVAGVGVAVVGLLMTPLGIVAHGLTLTPERAVAAVGLAVGLLPFSLAFGLLLRRGRPLRAVGFALAGRVMVLGLLVAGVRAGLTSPVVLLMLPALAILFIGVELVAGGLYAASRNRVAAAMLEAAWLGWIFAAVLPIRF